MCNARVWIPNVLERYACERALVCCSAPWRARVTREDADAVAAGLADAGAGRAVGARFRASLHGRGDDRWVAQRGGACSLLRADRGCTLHAAAGLAAMPALCRTFPRSVVATPDGLDVAFLLACPTAARLVAARDDDADRAPFALVGRSPEGWPYPPTGDAPRRLIWERESPRTLGWGRLSSLRRAWWRALGQTAERGGDAVARAVLALSAAPEAPSRALARRDLGPLARALDGDEAEELASYWALLPGRRDEDARAALAAALARPFPAAELVAAGARRPASWGTALSLAVQFAGAHTLLPVRRALHAAAVEVAYGLVVDAALARVGALAPADARRDALAVAARVGAGLA